jgi:hypothetical protein
MISPRLSKVVSGTRLTTGLINSMIKRTEYAADLLQQYKLIAGNQMYIEPHYDGTRVSYLQPVGGGTTPTQPISNDGTNPSNPLTVEEAISYYDLESQKTIPNNATKIYFTMSSFTKFTIFSTFMFEVSFADGAIRRAGRATGAGGFYYTTGFDVNFSFTRPNYSGFVTSVEFLFSYPYTPPDPRAKPLSVAVVPYSP